MGLVLLIILILLLCGSFAGTANWGYYPSGGIGLVVAILIVLLLLGKL